MLLAVIDTGLFTPKLSVRGGQIKAVPHLASPVYNTSTDLSCFPVWDVQAWGHAAAHQLRLPNVNTAAVAYNGRKFRLNWRWEAAGGHIPDNYEYFRTPLDLLCPLLSPGLPHNKKEELLHNSHNVLRANFVKKFIAELEETDSSWTLTGCMPGWQTTCRFIGVSSSVQWRRTPVLHSSNIPPIFHLQHRFCDWNSFVVFALTKKIEVYSASFGLKKLVGAKHCVRERFS